MIVQALFFSAVALQAGTQGQVEWDYPADLQAVSIRDFAACDYVAIARFVDRGTMQERNLREESGSSYLSPYVVDRYDVVDCPVGSLTGRVEVVVPVTQFMRRTRPPVVGSNYLIIGHKQVDGKIPTYNFELTYHGSPAMRYRVDSQSTREVSGVLQLRTTASQVINNADARVRVLLNIIQAMRNATDEDVRRATKILSYTRAKFSLSISNNSEEQIAGQNASAWHLQALTAALPQLAPTLTN